MKTIHPGEKIEKVPTLIRKTARDIAGAFYEGNRSDTFRKNYPDQYVYIELQWPAFVATAREILTDMLGNGSVSDHEKEEIYNALIAWRENATAINLH